jgi:hypothetical protein
MSHAKRRMFTTAAATLMGLAATTAAPATTLDLTTNGASGTLNSALFQQVNPQPTGTGVIDPIVRMQASTTEQGYNTDTRPVQFDELTDPNFTRSIQLGQVGTVSLSGVTYREFTLDINEPNNGPNSLLTLDKLQLFLSPTKTNTYPNLGTKIYDLGAGNAVLLDAALTHGSGSGDMFALVPDSFFAGHSPTEYLYLYSHFTKSSGGFEEWGVIQSVSPTPGPSVPEPSSAMVSLIGVGILGMRRRRTQAR